MKKNPFLLSALALSLLLSACSQSDLLNSQMDESTNAIELSASVDSTALRRAKVRATIQQRKDIFGQNVLIFDSYDELDTTLVQLQDMDAAALRKWATANSVKNDILESNIIYDQEWDNALEKYGLKMYDNVMAASLGTNGLINPFVKPVENRMDSANAYFLATMRSKYPQYLLEYDTLGEHFIETLGAMGEPALCNEKQLLVVDNTVHKYFLDGMVFCAVEDYYKIASCKTMTEALQYGKVQGLSYAQQMVPIPSNAILEYEAYAYNSKNTARMYVDVSVGVIKSVGDYSWRRVTVQVKNFRKNKKGEWTSTSYKTKLKVKANTNSTLGVAYTFNISHKHYMRNHLCSHYKRTKAAGSRVYMTGYDIEVSNSKDVSLITKK